MLLYLTATDPFSIELTFPAVEDPALVADAIGKSFDALTLHIVRGWRPPTGPMANYEKWLAKWMEHHRSLDPRLQIATEWAIVDDSMAGRISMFGA